jgi:hypothetical protein
MSTSNKDHPTVPTDIPEQVADPNVDIIKEMFDEGKSATEILDDWLSFKIDYISKEKEEAKRKYDAPDWHIFHWDEKDEHAYDVPISCFKKAKYILNLIMDTQNEVRAETK